MHTVEFVVRVPFAAFLHQFRGAIQHPLIDFFELVVRERIARRIEIAQIAQRKAEGVANLAVRFAELGHHALAHFHVGLILHRRHPQPQQIRAPALANRNGIKRVAERLGHRPALLVQSPTVCDHAAIRRSVARARGHEQRTVKPATILVRPFQINIRGPFRAFEHGEVR